MRVEGRRSERLVNAIRVRVVIVAIVLRSVQGMVERGVEIREASGDTGRALNEGFAAIKVITTFTVKHLDRVT